MNEETIRENKRHDKEALMSILVLLTGVIAAIFVVSLIALLLRRL